VDLDVALGPSQKAKSLQPEAPDSVEYQGHLGLNLIASGQKPKGKEKLEAALRLKQDSATQQQIRQARAQLN